MHEHKNCLRNHLWITPSAGRRCFPMKGTTEGPFQHRKGHPRQAGSWAEIRQRNFSWTSSKRMSISAKLSACRISLQLNWQRNHLTQALCPGNPHQRERRVSESRSLFTQTGTVYQKKFDEYPLLIQEVYHCPL